MKLVLFQASTDDEATFGLLIDGQVIGFNALAESGALPLHGLSDLQDYCDNLPESGINCGRHNAYAREIADQLPKLGSLPVDSVKLLSPFRKPAALLDFGLTPRHLENSAATMLRHEHNWFLRTLIKPIIRRKLKRIRTSAILPYYKCNHTSIIGDGDTVGWPAYTSYLDIEPELAFVVGKNQVIAGYMIYNDLSARDVQMPEMTGTGPTRSKDFAGGNAFGPYFVTPDEIEDPLNLEVKVEIGDRYEWTGTSREYSAGPEDVIRFLQTIFTPVPGTVIGMGTIPDCTGLDNDLWIEPGDEIKITFEKLGTLRQYVPKKPGPLGHSRWQNRPELEEFYR